MIWGEGEGCKKVTPATGVANSSCRGHATRSGWAAVTLDVNKPTGGTDVTEIAREGKALPRDGAETASRSRASGAGQGGAGRSTQGQTMRRRHALHGPRMHGTAAGSRRGRRTPRPCREGSFDIFTKERVEQPERNRGAFVSYLLF